MKKQSAKDKLAYVRAKELGLICDEMSRAMNNADVNYVAFHGLTVNMRTALYKFHDWAARCVKEGL